MARLLFNQYHNSLAHEPCSMDVILIEIDQATSQLLTSRITYDRKMVVSSV